MPRSTFLEVVRFLFIGLLSTATYFAVAKAFDAYASFSTLVNSVLAYLIAMFLSFFGHKIYTFKKYGNTGIQVPRFLVSSAVGLFLAVSIPILFVSMNPTAVYGIVCVSVPIVSFVLQKYFVFKE